MPLEFQLSGLFHIREREDSDPYRLPCLIVLLLDLALGSDSSKTPVADRLDALPCVCTLKAKWMENRWNGASPIVNLKV